MRGKTDYGIMIMAEKVNNSLETLLAFLLKFIRDLQEISLEVNFQIG